MEPWASKAKLVAHDKGQSAAPDKWFPEHIVPDGLDRFEVFTTQKKTGIYDYYCAFYDGHGKGEPNSIAKWIASIIGVPATGNFVIAHKNWNVDEETEENGLMGKTPKELQILFKYVVEPK